MGQYVKYFTCSLIYRITKDIMNNMILLDLSILELLASK